MKVILDHSEVNVPYTHVTYKTESIYWSGPLETKQDFRIYGDSLNFDVRMISKNGFRIPPDCDVEVEMKFTFTPKTPKSETITLK